MNLNTPAKRFAAAVFFGVLWGAATVLLARSFDRELLGNLARYILAWFVGGFLVLAVSLIIYWAACLLAALGRWIGTGE